jgi:hypothetical protein
MPHYGGEGMKMIQAMKTRLIPEEVDRFIRERFENYRDQGRPPTMAFMEPELIMTISEYVHGMDGLVSSGRRLPEGCKFIFMDVEIYSTSKPGITFA